MVSVALGLRQVLVWAGEQVQKTDQKKEGERGADWGSDTRTTSWSSEEGEREEEQVKMFQDYPETGISSQRNVYQQDHMWSKQATFNLWSKQATCTSNPCGEQATSKPHSCCSTSGVKGGISSSETVGDENVDTDQLRLCQRLQSELGFRLEEDDEESDGYLDPESPFRDETVTLPSYALQSSCSGSTSGQHAWNGSGYPVGGVEDNDDDDDGWISDKELIAPVLQPSDTTVSTAPAMKSYMYYDDDVWVDEAKAMFSACKKEQPEIKLRPLLWEMFEAHHDVFCLILAFLRRSGKIRQPKLSLPRIVVTEFQEWLKEKRSSGEKNKNAILTPDHQEEALKILTQCHPILLDDVCTIFDVKSVNRELQLSLIQSLLDLGKLKQAVTYTWKLQLQRHFSMEEMLLPLVAMDKINLIENYIGESQQLQYEFVMILDRLCGSGTSYKQLSSQLASSCRLGGKNVLTLEALEKQQQSPNNKLNAKQLFKLGMRFIQKYNLELDKFPLFSERKASSSLHYLLQKKYVEGSITDGNTDELIEAAVVARPALQSQLIQELVQFRDMEAAARWAMQCKIPLEHLPFELQNYLTTHRVRHSVWSHPYPSSTQDPSHPPQDFYELHLPLDRVFFVEDLQELQQCRETLTRPNTVIGVDAEWRLPACNGGIERLAVLQLAVAGSVFLLDMVHLPRRVKEESLRQFVSDVFGSRQSLKLGYGIDGDLHMLARSWVFVADIAACPERVVDLRVFARMVNKLDAHPSCGSGRTLPEHPLLRQLNCQHGTANHSPTSSHTPPPSSKTAPPLQHNLPTPKPFGKDPSMKDPSGEDPSREESSGKDPSMVGGEDLPSDSSSDPSVKRRGLSALVMKYLGKPLDKSQQLSDWEKRPLRVEQVKYAALDAYCLLELYSLLKSQALAADPYFNVEPTISAAKAGRSIFKKQKEEKGLTKSKPEVQNPPKRVGPPICPGELSVVVDTMLQGLGRYLRCCGVDVKILGTQQNHYDAVKVCLKECRIILTSGAPFFVMKDLVPAEMCVHISQGKARDQVLEVLDHFNVCVTEKDIFSRCQVCNGDNYVRIEVADFREIFNLVKQESDPETSAKISRSNNTTGETCTAQSDSKLEDFKQKLSRPAAEIKESEVANSGISTQLEGTSPTTCCTSVRGEEQWVPRLPPGSMTSVKDCPFARLGEGLSLQLTTTGHKGVDLSKPSSVVVVSQTGVAVQVTDVPEGILDRVTEFYCCTACGKVYWEGKHFAHVVHQFQHVLKFSRQL